MTGPTCDNTGCTNEACYHPVLCIYPYVPCLTPIEAVLSIRVCKECSKIAKAEDFMSDAGWARIEETLKAQMLAPPCRAKTGLKWVSIYGRESEILGKLKGQSRLPG